VQVAQDRVAIASRRARDDQPLCDAGRLDHDRPPFPLGPSSRLRPRHMLSSNSRDRLSAVTPAGCSR
jgi:hypothetical protein